MRWRFPAETSRASDQASASIPPPHTPFLPGSQKADSRLFLVPHCLVGSFRYVDEDDGEVSKEKLTIYVQAQNDPDNHVFVFFPKEPKVGVKKIKEYAEKMKEANVSNAIIIVPTALTPYCTNARPASS